ncbi:hypothetical protein ANME2D_02833 [Candidatus Methanoperedens nitroreducens]|uniref:Fibronectin type-III domain-containing protein n=1 Tax=Candidatus Methanoperedens nitratireducens TaxID=1392998 RepID=A0A062V2F7_9EURY|nr:carboxypeptidase regulatory-like domain-containing protein [Candidatus Methanoperedens nitroreducens]KCZ70808.1 hypothetical protein ANME2D_02833 [Candidatus Methanoperedens nitroreducens]MDJ1420662.1 carboxypeptidase regulatory-like domain-containing protein [Candidatus Methanoperedens sp.]
MNKVIYIIVLVSIATTTLSQTVSFVGGDHQFYESVQDKCTKCHGDIKMQLSASSEHSSYSCTFCHTRSENNHTNTKPTCQDCHSSVRLNDTREAHPGFASLGSEGCIACHTTYNVIVNYSRPEYIDYTIMNKNGDWVISDVTTTGELNLSYNAMRQGGDHNVKNLSCKDCHKDIFDAVSVGGHAVVLDKNGTQVPYHNNTNSNLEAWCRTCHNRDDTKFTTQQHSVRRTTCEGCHQAYNLTPHPGNFFTSINTVPHLYRSLVCISCHSVGWPAPTGGIHFKVRQEPYFDVEYEIITPLSITNSSPAGDPTTAVGTVQTFSITLDRIADVTWYKNGSEIFTVLGVTLSGYTNSNAAIGVYNITATADDGYTSALRTWNWTVTASGSGGDGGGGGGGGDGGSGIGGSGDGLSSISGYVFDNYGIGLEGVTVKGTMDNITAENITIMDGYYSITNLSSGTYNFSLSKAGFDTGYFEFTFNGGVIVRNMNKTIFDTTPPAQVTGLRSDNLTNSTVNLSWDPVEDANYYQLFRNSDSLGYTRNTYWNDTGLTPNVLYQYMVRANDSYNNWGQNSSVLTVNMPLTIISWSPVEDPTATEDTAQTFEVVLNKTADVTWYVNDSIAGSNSSIISANYTNSTAGIGVYNVTVFASDGYNWASRAWNWTVIEQPRYNLSGYVFDNYGLGLGDVLVQNSSYQNTTPESGYYSIGNLSNGTYNFSFSKAGFDTGYFEIIISGSDNTNENITIYDTTPPDSVSNPDATTGNFFINNTWINPEDADFDHILFRYSNDTTLQNVSNPANYLNLTWAPHYTQNISAQTVDIYGNINQTKVWFNATIPNNVPIQLPIGDKTVTEGELLTFNVSATDADSDTITYGTNATKGIFNTTTGEFSWIPGYEDAGIYIWYFNSSDGYDGVASETITVTVNDMPLSAIFSSPVSDPITTVGTVQTFEIDLNRAADVTWYIDGSAVQSNLSVISANYTDSTAGIGVYNITAIASDSFDSASRTWNWTVIAQPTYNVSGYVFDNNGARLGDVLVQSDSYQDPTIASGYYSITGLLNGTYNFSYSKYGFNTDYLEVAVNGADITNTNITIYDTTPPAQVTGLMNDTPTQTTVNISWDSIADASYYQVFRDSISIGYTQNTYWNDTGLTADTLYEYVVRANDSYDNWGQNSSILSVKTAVAADTTPPASVSNPGTTTGNFFINNTWVNPEDTDFSYVWFRYSDGTILQNITNPDNYLNLTWSPHYTQNISAQTVDTSGNVNQTKVWFNATIPNNMPIQLPIGDRTVTEGDLLIFNVSATDADSDTITYGTNATRGSLNPTTGEYSWQTGIGDSGTYIWYFSSSDGYGGVASETITITVTVSPPTEYIPPDPVNLASTQGNFWINYTWQAGAGNVTDSYNINVNGIWTNGTNSTYYNNSVGPHGWSNITVWAYNNSGSGSLSSASVSQNTQVVNNIPMQEPIGDKTIDENQPLQFTVSATDADSDLITYGTNATKGTFNITTGEFSWIPGYGDAGIYIWYFNSSDGYGGITSETITVTVNDVPLSITSSLPVSDPTTTVGTEQTFGIDLNRTADITWYIDSSIVHTDLSVVSASYANSTAGIGMYNVTAIASDNYDSVSRTWNWTVIEQPTYSVSGYVFDNNGAGLGDVDVLVQNGSHQDTTIASGYYSITGLLNGNYNFSFSKPGFDTGYLEVIINGADNTSANKTIYDTTPPAQVTGLRNDTPTQMTVNLSWYPIADASYYQVFRDSASLGYTQNTYWNDTGLIADTLYEYVVRANDSYDNWGQNSSILSVRTAPAADTTPSASVSSPAMITGNFYINNTWVNPEDPDFNYVWFRYSNDTTLQNVSNPTNYLNLTWPPHYTQNISAHTVDTSGNVNQTKVWFNATIPNNAPVQATIGNKIVTEGDLLTFNVSATDTDSDTITYGTNATGGLLNPATGEYSWQTSSGDSETYIWYFNSSDGYGGVATETITVIVNNVPLSITSSSPDYDPTTTVGTAQTFGINLNRNADVTWYIDGSIVQTDLSVVSASYANSTANIGMYNVTATASDSYDSVSRTWNWTVIEQPTYSVSGYVFDNNGAGLGDVDVMVQNGSKQDTTIASGYYQITGLLDGIYNFSYSKAGFNTDYLEVAVNGADITNMNITIYDTTPPAQVTGLMNDTPTQTTVNLSWDPIADASYYQVFRDSGSLGYTQNTYWNDTGLIADTLYEYMVRANDSYDNWGQNSSVLSIRTAQAADTTPPASVSNPSMITGNFFINNTWINPADSDFNYVWFKYSNGTTLQNVSNPMNYLNLTWSPHYTQNISAQTVDTSGNVNQTRIWFNVTIPNNVPVQLQIGNKVVDEGQLLTFTVSSTDADNDAITYGTNATKGTFNTTTGGFSWTPGYGDAGAYVWYFNSSDSYGGVTTETITITVNDIQLSITSSSPSSDPITTQGEAQIFSITLNRTADIAWYMNGVQAHTNTSVTSASYADSIASIGTYNVTAIASDSYDSASRSWNWTVIAQPTYSVSGYVFDNYGSGLEGILVQNGIYQNTTIASGYYLITGLLNGTYNLSFSKPGFDTGYLEITVSGTDIINVNKTIYDTTPPAQVTGLMNDTPTQTTVNISWDPVADASYYQVFRNSDSLGYTQNTYLNDNGLIADTLYQYHVRANDSYNNWGQNSSILSVKTAEAADTTPPGSVSNPSTTAGNFYINNTWINPEDADFDHVLFRYSDGNILQNVSNPMNYLNLTWSPHYTQSISAQTVDASGNVNQTKVWFNATIPNNAPVQAPIGDRTVTEGDLLIFNVSTTDIDLDPITYGTDATRGSLNPATGEYSWQTGIGDSGIYIWYFSSSDGYGGVASETITITVAVSPPTEYIPPDPVNLASTQGNFWINYTWQAGAGNLTDSYNISVDGIWINGTTNTYYNTSVGPHGWSNITVWAYNSSGSGSLSLNSISQNTQVANNVPIQESIGDRTIDENQLLQFTVTATDTDSDLITYGTNATKGIFNTTTGEFSWTPGYGDAGVYIWYFSSSDSYGGVATEAITITVNNVPLSITSLSPVNDPATTVGTEQTFEINLNRNADVTWYIDGSIIQSNSNVASASYTNSTADIGVHNITAIASDSYDSASRTWNWTVIAQPTYSVSGYVFDNYGSGLGDVLVQNGSYQSTTIASGYYLITGLFNGTYNFSFSKSGFDTGYLEVTISGADIINANKTIYDTTPPAQVTGLRNDTLTQTTVNFSWDTIADANYYQIFRNSANLGYTQNTYWNDTGLIADTLYEYAVRANDSYNNWGQNSSILSIRTAQAADTTPPASVSNPSMITGNFFINNTWINPADSDFSYVWFRYSNGTTLQNVSKPANYLNLTLSPHYTQNISAQTVDTSGNVNQTKVWFNTTIPNNVPVQSQIGNRAVDEGKLMAFTVSSTDTDNDTITYGTNATKGTFNTTTGEFSWTPGYGDAGVYIWYFNSSDNYGGVVSETIMVTISDVPLSITSSSPVSDPTTTNGTAQTFEIMLNRTADVTWYINGSIVESNSNVASASYTNSTADIGLYNVTAIASDIYDSVSRIWNWTVD